MKNKFRFQVIYSRCEFWDIPDVDDEGGVWEGEELVEQKLFGILTPRQFVWLLFERNFSETTHTQGILSEHGLIPAIRFYHIDNDDGCYVSVYTDEMMNAAMGRDKEGPIPVLGGGEVDLLDCDDLWSEMTNALPEIITKEDIEEGYCAYAKEDDLDRVANKVCKCLAEIMAGSATKAGREIPRPLFK